MNRSKRLAPVGQASFKLIMVGDSATGKSSLLTRYIRDVFQQQYNVTVGVEFGCKLLYLDEHYRVKLQIWDTAGQESFKSLIKSYFRNSAAVIMVYDITKKISFDNLNGWLQEARDHSPRHAMFVLIGTHLDLQSKRQVSKEEAETWMKAEGIAFFFETSAKTSENVSKAFEQVGKQLIYDRMSKTQTMLHSSLQLQNESQGQTQKSKCC